MSVKDAGLAEAARLLAQRRWAEAEKLCLRLLDRDGSAAEVWHLLGLVVFASGRVDEAAGLLGRAVELDPVYSRAHNNLGHIARRQGRWETALESHLTAVRLNPLSREYTRNLLAAAKGLVNIRTDEEMEHALTGGNTGDEEKEDHQPVDRTFSVVTCSINDKNFNRLSDNYRKIIPGDRLEIIRIDNARSLAEGYNRGFKRASGSIVIFCHDDLEIIDGDLARVIVLGLAKFDLVGAAGTTRLVGPGWIGAGWPHIHGLIVHHRPNGYSVDLYGPLQRTIPEIQALDGLFLAGERELFQNLPFDEQNFDHFHLYDIDLSYQAYQRGCRIAVLNDLGLIHRSGGRFDQNWNLQARRFMTKYQGHFTVSPPGKPTWAKAVFRDRTKALIFQKALASLMTGDRKGLEKGGISSRPGTPTATGLDQAGNRAVQKQCNPRETEAKK